MGERRNKSIFYGVLDKIEHCSKRILLNISLEFKFKQQVALTSTQVEELKQFRQSRSPKRNRSACC